MIKGAALFDLDGVLIDTYPQALKSIPVVAEKLRIRIPTEKEIKLHWGLGPRHYVKKFWPGLSPDTYESAHDECGFKNNAVPMIGGTQEVLDFFYRRYYMGIITNRDRDSLERRIRLAGIPVDYFDYIQPIENATAPKPDPRVFDYALHLISNQEINGGPVFYVGDTVTDFWATQGTGIRFIGVLTGPTSLEDFLEIGVRKDDIIPSIRELPDFLAG